ncbi:MAG: MFS transporter [Thermofilum sp.]
MEKSGKSKPGLRNVYALGTVSFLTDVSTEMVLGFLPVYVVQELGATRTVLGLMEGLSEFTNYLFRLLSGFLSDKIGRRKPLVFVGYFLSTVAKPLFAFARTPADAVAVRVADRVGKGIRTSPRDALLSQSVDEKIAGRAFGLHRTLDQSGAVLGPLLASALLPLLGPRNVFLLSFVPAALALAVLLLFVVEVGVERREASVLRGLSKVVKGDFALLLVAFAVLGLGWYDFSFVLLKSAELGLALSMVPLVYLGLNVFHTLVGYPAGVLSDRVGRKPLLALSMLLFSAASLAMAYSAGVWSILYVVALYGLHFGIYETVSRAVIPSYAPPELRGAAYGVFYIVTGFSMLVGMSLVGYLWDAYGKVLAFTYSAGMGLAAAALAAYLAVKR